MITSHENGLPLQGNDLAVRDIMIEAWTNFAIYGNPTPKGISELPPWTPVNSNFQLWNIDKGVDYTSFKFYCKLCKAPSSGKILMQDKHTSVWGG